MPIGEVPRPGVARLAEMSPNLAARSCATCGETACFRHEHRGPYETDHAEIARCAFLVDENWPEFQEYVDRAHQPGDVLGVPLDGARWRLSRYRWNREGFPPVGSAPLSAPRRAFAVRRAPAQGAALRTAEQIGAAGVDVTTFAREGDPADAILDVAEERDAGLIVVGNKGMTGAKRFLLGSVPNKVSHHAPCSVMIIRTT